MKRTLLLVAIAGMALLMVACGPQAAMKVAVLAPLSGPVPTFGASTRDGALLAIEEWNAKGGVLGRKIEPLVEDSQCTPDPAVNAANKVIDQDKVKFIVGEVCSSASIPISEIANKAKVVQISPTSTNPSVTVDASGATKAYIFRACFTDELQGRVGADFAIQKGFKSAFLMYDQSNDYVLGLSGFFEKEFTAKGGTIAGKEAYSGKDTDFSAILAKIKSAKPDVVYLPDYYNVVNLVTKQAKEKGITIAFMGGDGWDSSDLDAAASAGGYFTNHYSPTDPRPEVQSFLKAYAAKYSGKVPDALATLAYDATNMLLTSVKTAGSDNTDKVKDAMAKIDFNGVSGRITFDAQHNPVKTVTIIKVTATGPVYETAVAP